MAVKKPRWMESAIRYEKGFLQVCWREIKNNKVYYYKSLALLIVIASTMSVLFIDFESIEPNRSEDGIKAPVFALGAAAILFLNLVSTRGKIGRLRYDKMVRLVGGIFAFMAAVFWFLAETNGNIRPYMVPMVLYGAVLFTALFLNTLLGFTVRLEGDYLRRRESEQERGE